MSISRHTAAEQGIVAKLAGLPSLLVADPSYVILMAGLVVFALLKREAREVLRDPKVGYLLIVALVTPPALYLLGKYPTYYSWMAYVPLVVGGGVWASALQWSRTNIAIGGVIVALACVIGLPARAGVSVLQWEGRSYAPVDELVERHVTSADTVFAWYQGYYAVKGRAAAVYLPKYLWRVTEAKERELRRVNKLVMPPRYATPVMRFLGDRWERLGRTQAGDRAVTQFLGRALAEPYDVAVYVRRDSAYVSPDSTSGSGAAKGGSVDENGP